jgi:hypothetical protein
MDERVHELRQGDLLRRLEQLERDYRKLKSRERIFAVALVCIVIWLVWPTKTLTLDRLIADAVSMSSEQGQGNTLDQRGLYLVYERDQAFMVLSVPKDSRTDDRPEGAPRLYMANQSYGQIEEIVDARGPAVRLFAHIAASGERGQPQIELALVGPDRAPRIVLRDVNGQEVWHAP